MMSFNLHILWYFQAGIDWAYVIFSEFLIPYGILELKTSLL